MSLLFKSFLFGLYMCSAWASNKVGNGGNILKCENGAERPAQLLDFYEGSITSGSTTAISNANDIVIERLKKLEAIHPSLGSSYLARFKKMVDEIEFRGDIELVAIDDSKHIAVPKGCQVVQIAVRRTDMSESGKRFLIRQDLWAGLPAFQRAGLLTHELIYEYLAKLGEVDSIKARKLNALLFTSDLDKEKFWKTIRTLRLPIYP